MVLDTVDGKLARCTITSSTWWNVFDHGIDLVHPPFRWYAWGLGLTKVHLGIGNDTLWALMAVIVIGHVLHRLIVGESIRAFVLLLILVRHVHSPCASIPSPSSANHVLLEILMFFK